MFISPTDSSSCKEPKKWHNSLCKNERILTSGHGRIWFFFSSGRVMHLMPHKMLVDGLQDQSKRNSSFIQISNYLTSAALGCSLQKKARLFLRICIFRLVCFCILCFSTGKALPNLLWDINISNKQWNIRLEILLAGDWIYHVLKGSRQRNISVNLEKTY